MEIENPGNLGAIARVMKNFGFKDLVLINPKCKKTHEEAKNRAKHAQDILKNAKVKTKKYLKQFDYLIATTASLGSDYNIPRTPLTPEQLKDKIGRLIKTKIGILIGREGPGLTNKEIQDADFTITIPTSKRYPTLNISHAVAVICYELQKSKENITSHYTPASKTEKDILLKMVNKNLDKIKFETKEKRQTQQKVWKRLINKAFMTKREIFAILGFFRKLR